MGKTLGSSESWSGQQWDKGSDKNIGDSQRGIKHFQPLAETSEDIDGSPQAASSFDALVDTDEDVVSQNSTPQPISRAFEQTQADGGSNTAFVDTDEDVVAEPSLQPIIIKDFRLTSGSIIARRFEVIEEIGAGGMGTVYKVKHLLLHKKVLALKMMNALVSSEMVQRFQQEAHVLYKLKHPNIVSLREFGVDDNSVPYMAMDFVEGTSLSRFIRENFAIDDGDRQRRLIKHTVACAMQICDGLEHAHNQQILHRDLKPSNVMISTTSGGGLDVTILDFGIAKINDASVQQEQTLTRTGQIFGSPPYMSPEQCLGQSVDRRSDLYSLGCLIYECLTGAPPFIGKTAYSTMAMHVQNAPPSLNEGSLGETFPAHLDAIVGKLLRKKPEERYQTAADLKSDLQLLTRALWDDSGEISGLINQLPKSVAKSGTGIRTPVPLAIGGAASLIAIASAFYLHGFLNHNGAGTQATAHRTAYSGDNSSKRKVEPADVASLSMPSQNETQEVKPRSDYDQYVMLAMKSANKLPEDHSGKNLTDAGLSYLSTAYDLTKLDLSRTRVSDFGMRKIRGLALQYLNLSHDNISDVGVRQLNKIHSLQNLDLSDTHVSGSWLEGSSIRSLYGLDLSGTNFVDEHMRNLEYYTDHLKHLLLARTALTDAAFPRKLYQIELLDLSGTKITDRTLSNLGSMPLHELYLSGDKITDDGVALLAPFKYIFKLDLSHTGITDKSLSVLAKMPDLRYIDLSGTHVTDAGLIDFLQKAPKLQWLALADTSISDRSIAAISRMKYLIAVDLRGTQVTESGITKLAGSKMLYQIGVDQSKLRSPAMKKKEADNPQIKIDSEFAPHYPLPVGKKLEMEKAFANELYRRAFKAYHHFK